jgi:hypothetical protein
MPTFRQARGGTDHRRSVAPGPGRAGPGQGLERATSARLSLTRPSLRSMSGAQQPNNCPFPAAPCCRRISSCNVHRLTHSSSKDDSRNGNGEAHTGNANRPRVTRRADDRTENSREAAAANVATGRWSHDDRSGAMENRNASEKCGKQWKSGSRSGRVRRAVDQNEGEAAQPDRGE